MTLRALVTGAAGFVGSHLVDRLLADGYDVVGVDDLSTGRRENLAHLGGDRRFELIEHDVSKPRTYPGRFDWIFHFACPASPPKYLARPLETLDVCALGTRELLGLARAQNAGFFLASTSEVYGDPHVHPQPESYWGHVNPIGARSVYDEAKRFAEAYTMASHRAHGAKVRVIRIFNTYGPRMDPSDGRVVTNFVMQALRGEPITIYGDGSQTRSFQYVDDLIEGIARYMKVDDPGPVNLGNPEEFTMIELAEAIQAIVGTKLPLERRPLPADDPRQRKPDISKAKSLLGWAPKCSVREGLARTIEHFRRFAT
jgi:dTDP-glucose 4,6-dehydratase